MSSVFLDCAVDASLLGKGAVGIVRLYVHSGLLRVFDLTLSFMPIVLFLISTFLTVQMHDISLHRVKFPRFSEQF